MTIERPRFTTNRFAEAYDMGEVDDAVDRIFAALAEPVPPMAPADVHGLRFTPTRLRDGYDMGEVDAWLDVAAAELAQRGGTAPPAGSPAPAPSRTAPATPRPDPYVELRTGPAWRRYVAALTIAAVVVLVSVYWR
jgi:DivIVA domain-containing protein